MVTGSGTAGRPWGWGLPPCGPHVSWCSVPPWLGRMSLQQTSCSFPVYCLSALPLQPACEKQVLVIWSLPLTHRSCVETRGRFGTMCALEQTQSGGVRIVAGCLRTQSRRS